MSRTSKAIKGKRKVVTKKARPPIKRRAVPKRMQSERRVEEVTHGAGNYGIGGARDSAGAQAGEAVALATNAAASKMTVQSRSDPLQGAGPDTVARTPPFYPQATATALAALQAWFLLPLRILQNWQEAWFRLLPR